MIAVANFEHEMFGGQIQLSLSCLYCQVEKETFN